MNAAGAWAACFGLAALAASGCRADDQRATSLTGGNADRGREIVVHYGCTACHTIPGVPGANGSVGPALGRMAMRAYVAGHPNTPENMVRWLRHPKRIRPESPMPEMGVNAIDARDIAAYLYTLR